MEFEEEDPNEKYAHDNDVIDWPTFPLTINIIIIIPNIIYNYKFKYFILKT